MTTLYDSLGVSPDASPAQIKEAWRKARRQWHPDHNRGHEAEATQRFQDIKVAFEVLSDPQTRACYDSTLERNAAYDSDSLGNEAAHFDADGVFQTYAKQFEIARDMVQSGALFPNLMQTLMKEHHCPPALARRLALRAMAIHKGGEYVAQSQNCEFAASAAYNARSTAETKSDVRKPRHAQPAGISPELAGVFNADGVYERYEQAFETAQDMARAGESFSTVMQILKRQHRCHAAIAHRLALRAMAIHQGGECVEQSNICEHTASVIFNVQRNAKRTPTPADGEVAASRRKPASSQAISGWRLVLVLALSLLSAVLRSH